MKIAIIQPTPFKKGHYFIYTKSLFDEIRKLKYQVKIISFSRIYSSFNREKKSKLDFNIYSLKGLVIYLSLCFSTICRFIVKRNSFNRIIILDCEYSCVSFLLLTLKLLKWNGKITLQVNAPNFDYDFTREGFSPFRILKLIQTFIFRYSINLLDLKISCLGKWHKNKLSQQLSFSKEKIVIIEDGGGGNIDKLQEDNLLKKLEEESIVFPKKNKKIFLLFGNFRKDKGHLFLSKVWKKYFDNHNDPYLWIVGHDEENISASIFGLNAQNIIIHNYYVPMDLIGSIYQKTDFAILPYLSNYKGGSGPLMKGAFTNFKLALVSNVSEMGRLATEERLGEFFEAENESSLIECINRVLKNGSEYYYQKISNANNYANERNWESLAIRFISSLE